MYASYSPAPRTNTWQPAGGEGYWPTGLLEAFTLQMASHGHSVSSSMMMGESGRSRPLCRSLSPIPYPLHIAHNSQDYPF